MDVPGISRPVLVALIAVAVLTFATGVIWALAWVTHHTDTHTRTLPAGSAIDVQALGGDVQIVGTERSDVRLTTKERRSMFATPHVRVRYEAGRLLLDSHCSGADLVGSGCAVSYRVEVPRAMAVKLVAQSGDVGAEDLGGDADLRTSSGDVDATGVGGRLSLRTSSGDVDADSSSTDIDAQTTSGDVDVRARDATRVRAEATSGDVHVSVPDRTYAVQTRATSGDEHVGVHVDDNAPRRIAAGTTSGDVHVTPDG